jgi:lipopolysaccharide export system permease protein
LLRIQRFIFVELVVTLVLTLFVVTAVLFAGLCLQTMGRFDGLSLRFLMTLLPPLLPLAIAFSLPFAYLLAVALVYGRLVADRELVAIRIAGIHPRVAAAPAIALGAFLSVASLLFTGWVLPEGAMALELRKGDLAEQFLSQLSSSQHVVTTPQCRLSWASYEPSSKAGEPGVFRDFELDLRGGETRGETKILGEELSLARQDDGTIVVSSPRAFLARVQGTGLELSLKKGYVKNVGPVEGVGPPAGFNDLSFKSFYRFSVGHVESLEASTGFNELIGARRFEAKARQVPLPDVFYLVRRGNLDRVPLRRSLTELHLRFSTAAMPLLFALVAVGICFQLSTRTRRLTGFLSASLPVLFVHIPLWLAGMSLSDSGRVPAPVAMWAPDAVLLVAGTALFARSYRR